MEQLTHEGAVHKDMPVHTETIAQEQTPVQEKSPFVEKSTKSERQAVTLKEAVFPETAAKKASGDRVFLFKTPTCPNCKAAGALLKKAGVGYTSLNANEEKELVMKFGVKQAPTLVLVHGDSFEKYRGVSDIKGWLKSGK